MSLGRGSGSELGSEMGDDSDSEEEYSEERQVSAISFLLDILGEEQIIE